MSAERNDDETVLEGSGNVFADLGLRMSDDDMFKVFIARAITRIVQAGGYAQSAAAKIMKTGSAEDFQTSAWSPEGRRQQVVDRTVIAAWL